MRALEPIDGCRDHMSGQACDHQLQSEERGSFPL
jgi:hypothetical protein